MLDRLALTESRIASMAEGVRQVAAQADPIGEVVSGGVRPNGMRIRRVRVPLGVVGMIYESRPNVTADAAALCLKAGNAVILRGGKEAIRSNCAILDCMDGAARAAGLPDGQPAARARHLARLLGGDDGPHRLSGRADPTRRGRADPLRGGELPRARDRDGRGQLPPLPRRDGRRRHGRGHRRERQNAAAFRVQRAGEAACPREGRAGAAAARRPGAHRARRGAARRPARPRHPAGGGYPRRAGLRRGLGHRISRPHHGRARRARSRRGDRPHLRAHERPQRVHRDERLPQRQPLHLGDRRGGRVCELLHPLHGRRRVRPGRGDRHLHAEAARPRPDGRERADFHQIHH